MSRFIAAFVGVVLLAAGPVRAADHPASGTWKLTFPIEQGQKITFLLMLSESDKGWVGDYIGSSLQLRFEPTVDKVVVKDDNVSFDLKLGATPLAFDGRVDKDRKKVAGSFTFNGNTFLINLLPSKLKNLNDKFALARETLDQSEGGQEYFDAVFNVLGQATAKKLKPEEVRAYVDRTAKLAEAYGQRWQRNVALKTAAALADQEAFAAIALEQGRQAERMLRPDEDAAVQMQVLEELAGILKKGKRLDELKPIEARLTKLEARDHAEYVKKSPFKPEEFKGRKGKGDRTVLVELFTGADVQQAAAVDLAFDALGATYKPTDVVLMSYHLPSSQARMDPLTNSDALARAEWFGQRLRTLPSIFFNGKRDEAMGGSANAAKARYASYREAIEEQLEKPAAAKLQLSAAQKGDEISIKANVSDLAEPGEKVVLRFALVEDRVRYTGANGLRYHHNIVRAFPGGTKGAPLTKKSSEHTATVKLSELRDSLNKFLDDTGKGEDEPAPDRPIGLRNLKVVAFVQDDATGDVLQAAQVDVDEK